MNESGIVHEGTRAQQLLWRVVKVAPGELGALVAAFLYFFFLLGGYFILRPVRDTMGITSGVSNLPALFWGTLAATVAVQPLYGWLASRFRRTVFLPWVYGFFILNLLAFYAWFRIQEDQTWIARAFFVWISVFNLFVVSVFWSLMADIFRREQAKRLYGAIAAGGSLGGLVGPVLAALLAPVIGSINLLLVTACMLVLAVVCVRYLTDWHARVVAASGDGEATPDVDRPIGGNPWAGLYLIFTHRYLFGVTMFVFLLTWVSTFIYLPQAAVMAQVFQDPDEQTRVFGWVDASVQALSLLTQLFAFSHLAARFGLRVLLVAVPLLMVAVFIGLTAIPTLSMLIIATILRRVGEFAITRPCREMLFTVVDRETKYKAKNTIDTLVFRSGDAVSGSLHAGLVWLGVTLTGTALAGAGIAGVWAIVAYGLAKSFENARTEAPAAQKS